MRVNERKLKRERERERERDRKRQRERAGWIHSMCAFIKATRRSANMGGSTLEMSALLCTNDLKNEPMRDEAVNRVVKSTTPKKYTSSPSVLRRPPWSRRNRDEVTDVVCIDGCDNPK